jgi:hypothetical protein
MLKEYLEDKMEKFLIIGCGEIGKSIYSLFTDTPFETIIPGMSKECNDMCFMIQDIDMKFTTPVDYLCIAIPFSNFDKFSNIIGGYLKIYNPQATIIHSTVIPGTTDKLHNKYNKHFFHIPINGKHPNLVRDIKNIYDLYIGKPLVENIQLDGHIVAVAHTIAALYKSHIDQDIIVKLAIETELGKILCTTYYGWNLVFSNYVYQICKTYGSKLNVNLDEFTEEMYNSVYTRWNKNYNQGMTRRGTPEFKRPILTPPKGGINGHCVVENSILMKEEGFDLPIFNEIIQIGKPDAFPLKPWLYCELSKENTSTETKISQISMKLGITEEMVLKLVEEYDFKHLLE